MPATEKLIILWRFSYGTLWTLHRQHFFVLYPVKHG